MPPHAFSLGPQSLRYASFQDSSAGRGLLQEAEVPVSSSWFGDGVIGGPVHEESALHAALETLMGKVVESPKKANLVLAGEWVRSTYLELDHVPKRRAELDEVVQWKLRQVIPFRVDDVRLSHVPVGDREANRFLVSFSIDRFLRQLEATFAAQDIQIGSIQPVSVALFGLIPSTQGLDALLWGSANAVSLIAREDGEPVLLRYRRFNSDRSREATVRRDLRLSRSWIEENSNQDLVRMSIAAREEDRTDLERWCREDLGAKTVQALDLSAHNLPAADVWKLAPLLGAVSRRVA